MIINDDYIHVDSVLQTSRSERSGPNLTGEAAVVSWTLPASLVTAGTINLPSPTLSLQLRSIQVSSAPSLCTWCDFTIQFSGSIYLLAFWISSNQDCTGRSIVVKNGAFVPTLQGTNFDNNISSWFCTGKIVLSFSRVLYSEWSTAS